jgi:hypothetical protein
MNTPPHALNILDRPRREIVVEAGIEVLGLPKAATTGT